MKKIAITLILVSGLYITKGHAEGTITGNTKPDSAKMNLIEMAQLENVAQQAVAAADQLLSDPHSASPEFSKDEEASRAFQMDLISFKAAKDAELIRTTVEE